MAWIDVSFPPSRKWRIVTSAGKVMTTVFWDAEGTVLTDYVEHGSTITGTYYADLIGIVWAALKEKRWEESCVVGCAVSAGVDNAPARTSSQALAATRQCRVPTTPSPTVFPRLIPYLFPKVKEFTKRRKFADHEKVTCATNCWLKNLNQQLLYSGVQTLDKRWTKCISVADTMLKKDKTGRDYSALQTT